MDVNGKTVIVAGLGISGRSMMQVLKPRAGKVIGVDEKQPDADLHSFDQIDWDDVDLVMTSPVFNPRTPFILEAQRRGIPGMATACERRFHRRTCTLDRHHRNQWQDLHHGNDFRDAYRLRTHRTGRR